MFVVQNLVNTAREARGRGSDNGLVLGRLEVYAQFYSADRLQCEDVTERC